MLNLEPQTDVRKVKVAKAGSLIRVSHKIEGGAVLVDYQLPKSTRQIDQASRNVPSSAKAALVRA